MNTKRLRTPAVIVYATVLDDGGAQRLPKFLARPHIRAGDAHTKYAS